MLYITTRTANDAHTAVHALKKEYGPEGGLYVPFQLPVYTPEDILSFRDKSFSRCAADILDVFFTSHMSSWDVECCIGRRPIRMKWLNGKILIAESWRTADIPFQKLVRSISTKLQGIEEDQVVLTSWICIAARIAVLFGLFGELMRSGAVDPEHPLDVAVAAGDFTVPMSYWYARKMGLPVGNIICSCTDSSDLWDLMNHGELMTDPSAPVGLERLIGETLGIPEACKYAAACESGSDYAPPEGSLDVLRKGIYTAVVSKERMEAVRRNVRSSCSYTLDPASAYAYAGMQDYRSNSGDSSVILILSEQEGR